MMAIVGVATCLLFQGLSVYLLSPHDAPIRLVFGEAARSTRSFACAFLFVFPFSSDVVLNNCVARPEHSLLMVFARGIRLMHAPLWIWGGMHL